MNGQLRKAINIKGMVKRRYDTFKTQTIKKNIQKTMQPSHKTKAPINGFGI